MLNLVFAGEELLWQHVSIRICSVLARMVIVVQFAFEASEASWQCICSVCSCRSQTIILSYGKHDIEPAQAVQLLQTLQV